MSAIMYLISMKGYNDQHKKSNVTIIKDNSYVWFLTACHVMSNKSRYLDILFCVF